MWLFKFLICFPLKNIFKWGKLRQFSTTTNHLFEFPKFEEIQGIRAAWVPWISLTLGKPPSWKWYRLCCHSELGPQLHSKSRPSPSGVPIGQSDLGVSGLRRLCSDGSRLYPDLQLNLSRHQGQLWTPDFLAFASQVLGLQACATTPNFSLWTVERADPS